MSYVPKHLEYLDRSPTADGWPKFVTDEGKAFCETMVRRGFKKYGYLTLDLARECIFDDYVYEKGDVKPECLKGIALWDALYAVAYRALLAVDAKPIWKSKDPD